MNKGIVALACVLLALIGCTREQSSDRRSVEHGTEISNGFSKCFLADIALISLSRQCIEDIEGFFPEDALVSFKNAGHRRIYFDIDKDSVTAYSENDLGGKFSAKCRCIGIIGEKSVVMSEFSTGCCGITTDVFLCWKVEGGYKLKLIVGGNRANNGIVNIPELKGHKLYFDQYVDLQYIAKIAEASEKIVKAIPENHPQEYWNLSKCVYDFDTNQQSILETIIYEDAEAVKFLGEPTRDLISFLKYKGKPITIPQKDIPSFLKKFKQACERFYQKNLRKA